VKLTVVGCSPAWPNPGGAQSGYLVEGSGRLLLDCGPGVLARLRSREPWPLVDAIAITHFHQDHWADLVSWVFGASFGAGRDAKPPQLWVPPGGRATLDSFGGMLGFGTQLDRAFSVREYADGVPFETAGFEVVELRPLGGLWSTVAIEVSYGLQRYRRSWSAPAVDATCVSVQWLAKRVERVDNQPKFSWNHLIVGRRPKPR